MQHRLVSAVEKALGWNGTGPLGTGFVRGHISDPGLIERLLTPSRLLDLMMRRSVAHPQIRAFRDGEQLHTDTYLTTQTTRRGQTVPMANMRRLGQLLTAGATLVLDQANVFDPTMEVACRAVQWWARERVQVNVYLTTNDASGFNLHWDDHDVLVVQLSGEKTWEVRGASRPVPMYRDAARNDEPGQDSVWSGVMRAGDVMHIPRGYWHQATRTGQGAGHSLHMTLGITQRTGVSWLAWLADWSRESELFRHDLDRWATADAQHRQQQGLAEAAARLIEARGTAEFLDAVQHDAGPARHVPFVAAFGPLEGAVCITEFPPRIRELGAEVEVTAAGKRLVFDPKAVPALRLLLSGRPVRLEEAAARAVAEVMTVAEILVEEELCAPLTPELSSGYTGLVPPAPC